MSYGAGSGANQAYRQPLEVPKPPLGPKTDSMPPVTAEMSLLGAELDVLENTAAELIDRLRDVLKPGGHSDKPGGTVGPAEIGSNYASIVAGYRARIVLLRVFLSDALARLEV